MNRSMLVLPLVLILSSVELFSQNAVLADIRDIREFDVKSEGFALDAPQEISIHAVAAGDRFRGAGSSAWILNADTREVVWKLHQARQRSRSRGLADYEATVQLPKGNYEAYFAAYSDPGDNIDNFGDFVDFIAGRVFDGNRRNRDYRNMTFTIHGAGRNVGQDGMDRWREEFRSNTVVSLSSLWDNSYVQQGFSLDKTADVTVYAIGEGRDEDLFDYGWIINTKTGARVWEMNERNTGYAGGATKNREVRETLSLPAGQYAAFFVTDDSHSHRDWNAPPPYDPSFWGMTIWLNDKTMKKYAKTYEYKAAAEKNIIVALTRMGDRESQTKSFTLKKPMDVRVLAVGEGRDSEMDDYGWITEASSRRRVWTMEYDETSHAGGDRKNRMVDKVIHLDKGTYSVHFITDDSHSYRHWNASAPFDPEHWGITVSAAVERYDPKDVIAVEDVRDPAALASIVRVGSDERRRKEFSLSQNSEIRIYAVGEASGNDMADYAWIEDVRSGKTVWEMRYRMTEHAGGARKNRVFDGTITLPAGKYMLFYETDDSHAYNDWNDSSPDDPEGWGATVSLVKEAQR